MFKCYDFSKLQNELLKCDKCHYPFISTDQPKLLPCGETICTSCEIKIEIAANKSNRQFICSLCLKEHFIPENRLPINKKVCGLITAELVVISRGKEYEKLEKNLNNLLSKTQSLWSDGENSTKIITENCNEQIRLIQLSATNKIEQINKLSGELITHVIEDKKIYTESFLLIKEDINKLINEANLFINEKQAYLQQYKLDDDETNLFNNACQDLEVALKKKSEKFKSFLFNKKLIKFLSNNKAINRHVFGTFDYEQLTEPSVCIFLVYLIITQIYFKYTYTEGIYWIFR
jgi:hypothetical protein